MSSRYTACLLLLCCQPLIAAPVEMRFHGRLVEDPPCVLNEGKPVDIYFGDALGIKKIDGVNYSQTLALTLVCSEDAGDTLAITLHATGSDFAANAVKTDVDGLAIRFSGSDGHLALNTALPIASDPVLALSAVPVKDPARELAAGDFHAAATLRLHYY